MIIRSKADSERFLTRYNEYFGFDGNKHYFVIDDHVRGGWLTIMRYPSGEFTLHGKGEGYCDATETAVSIDELIALIYQRRKYVHVALKNA